MMRTAYLARLLAVFIPALGIATLPHAERSEHLFDATWLPTGLISLSMPHLLGLIFGLLAGREIARMDWSGACAIRPRWWLAAAFVVTVFPLTWRDLSDDRLMYYGVDSLILALPFLAAWAAGMNAHFNEVGTSPGWWFTLLVAALVAGLVLLAAPFLPTDLILLVFLLVALVAPGLRRIMGMSFALLFGVLGLMFVSNPFRLERVLSKLPLFNSAPDIYGADYQSLHVADILQQLTWFGGDAMTHLPRAISQLLPVSMAEQWGGIAFVGVFVSLGVWLLLVRPQPSGSDPASRFRRTFTMMLWLFLLFVALDNAAGNLGLLAPHGAGMPLFSGNWGLLLLAWLLMGANGQLQAQTPHAHRLRDGGDPGTIYHCWSCRQTIGAGIDALQWGDTLIGRGGCVYCSTECFDKEARHQQGWRALAWTGIWWLADTLFRWWQLWLETWKSWFRRLDEWEARVRQGKKSGASPYPADAPRTCRLLETAPPTTVYFCWNCHKVIGLRAAVLYSDKTDRTYCCDACQSAARNHPSWEYECRGGDY